jgi:hypothetical protein
MERHAALVNILFQAAMRAAVMTLPFDRLELLEMMAKIFSENLSFYKNTADMTLDGVCSAFCFLHMVLFCSLQLGYAE